jgi:hypothetical protein
MKNLRYATCLRKNKFSHRLLKVLNHQFEIGNKPMGWNRLSFISRVPNKSYERRYLKDKSLLNKKRGDNYQ